MINYQSLLQDLCGVVFSLYFLRGDDALNHSFLIDDEGGAESTHIFTSVHALFTPYTELFYQFLVCVCNKGKGQVVLFDEFLVRLLVVYADSDNFITGLAQVGIVVAQVADLRRTARSRVFWIKAKY